MAQSQDIKNKIQNLLALAESPNENEAKIALLKARELMVKYKLNERVLKDFNSKLVENILTDITFTKRKDPWICELSAVIAENHCCKGYRQHAYRGQTQIVGFIGFENDVEICINVFKYAVNYIRANIKTLKNEYKRLPAWYIRQQCDSYGFGFVDGIKAAYEEQDDEHTDDWGLVLVLPKEVQESATHLKKKVFKASTEDLIDDETYQKGFEDGKEFDPSRKFINETSQNADSQLCPEYIIEDSTNT